MITIATLAGIRVLYRAPDTLALYGIPYAMRREIGQEPRHLVAGHRDSWTWLGSPGWWGNMARDEQALVRTYSLGDSVPEGPHEWCEIPD